MPKISNILCVLSALLWCRLGWTNAVNSSILRESRLSVKLGLQKNLACFTLLILKWLIVKPCLRICCSGYVLTSIFSFFKSFSDLTSMRVVEHHSFGKLFEKLLFSTKRLPTPVLIN